MPVPLNNTMYSVTMILLHITQEPYVMLVQANVWMYLINFAHRDLLDRWVFANLPRHATIATSYDQYLHITITTPT